MNFFHKTLLASALLFSMTVAAPAVKTSSQNARVQFGTRTALGIGGFNFHNESDLGFGFSGSVGMAASIPLPLGAKLSFLQGLAFAPELSYTLLLANMEETSSDPNFGSETESMNVSMHSIDLPLLLRYPLPGKLPLFVVVGPQFGYILSSNTEYKLESDWSPLDNINTDGDTEGLNHFTLGTVAGLGYQVNKRLLADLRYTFGGLEYAKRTNGRPYTVHAGVNYLF